ncbi:hypothetical protein [Sorangium atrum]|uniref:Secreted protein n=1 Tax=Sorangium atrum TaxID=2995308 RepID=A0ABT5BT81_9BACT|nr:hypothetical protein [Sorangium aterium]MDC0677374.1 hypothetical protein [Sorangium aterium]
MSARRSAMFLSAAALAIALAAPATAPAQDDPEADTGETEEEATPEAATPATLKRSTDAAPMAVPADFGGSLQVVRAPPGTASAAASSAGGPEIFPDARRVWMSVRDTDPVPIEAARRGGRWLCSGGGCAAQTGDPGQSAIGDQMLRSIKLQTPTLPLPLTVWGRLTEDGQRLLDFDPVLLGRRSYRHVCAYRPVADAPRSPVGAPAAPGAPSPLSPERVDVCRDGRPEPPPADAGELTLGMQWPKQSEMADFHYLAIVDSCGNARVQPFQRTFTVPVLEVASGGCGRPDGKILRVFPGGGWLRVTAFNLHAPAAGNVVNATYRVTIPPLENLVESNPARLLFPDPLADDLKVDCGPTPIAPRTDAGSTPPPGSARPPGPRAPSPAPPGIRSPPRAAGQVQGGAGAGRRPPTAAQTGPTAQPGAAEQAPQAPAPPAGLPPPRRAPDVDPSRPGPQPLAHGAVVISPAPLRLGNCRIRLTGQAKHRLVAPLALYVSLTRTDQMRGGTPIELLQNGTWIVTPSSAEFPLPPLAEDFDGDARLRLAVYSDPLSPQGKVVLVSDAGRVASSLRSNEPGEPERARRLVGSVAIHSVPLCGEDNFQTLEAAGTCFRAYLTVPAMLATLQVTRAPWVEKPLVTRSVLSAVGVALAIDRYDPVERRAFPIAAQLGGFVQTLGEGRVGLLGYVGVAPTIPILGSGGNTTSFGFLAGLGLEYITNDAGPDEGLKPAAFVSAVVQVGQAAPQVSTSGRASFGTYAGD